MILKTTYAATSNPGHMLCPGFEVAYADNRWVHIEGLSLVQNAELNRKQNKLMQKVKIKTARLSDARTDT